MKPTSAAASVLVVLAVVLSYVTGSSASRSTSLAVGTAPVVNATLVCPVVNGEPSGTTTVATVADVADALDPAGTSSGTVTATTLAQAKSRTATVHPRPVATITSTDNANKAVEITATGSIASTLTADQVMESPGGRYRGLASGPCLGPRTDWWFAGVDGRVGYSDNLWLANPAKTNAEVTVTLWSHKGAIKTAHLDAVRLAPQTQTRVPIATVAPNQATIGLHVHADSGAVTAAVVQRRTSALASDGGDLIPATLAPNRSQIVPGYARGAGFRYLFVSNPGAGDATVDLKLVAGTGTFTPSGVNQIVVKTQQTSLVNLSQVFGTQTGAVQVSSDQPVIAEGLSSLTVTHLRPDRQWLSAEAPIEGTVAVANGHDPDGGQCLLLLSAPREAASVTVRTPSGHARTISVPAGKSIEADITSTVSAGSGPWPFTVTTSGGPVYGTRMLNFGGAHGPLITSEPLTPLPSPIALPPVRPDPRIAVR